MLIGYFSIGLPVLLKDLDDPEGLEVNDVILELVDVLFYRFFTLNQDFWEVEFAVDAAIFVSVGQGLGNLHDVAGDVTPARVVKSA